ncbi:cytochrome P450 [Paractinoplanes hotanensis]|uniref:Cytochrome P450 n=1 Tax=Paractinoplanes hotanensis TaxID=2906497 RepID=A0ABT0YC44_9ACTN|nr:cytochrome P450 [Actinoplanes hotanensis]MCM4083619.1 cytochrome P450 [Actinoplanes hotanensis]
MSVPEPYDLDSDGYFSDPYPTYDRMRVQDPVYFDESKGLWYVTRHADVLALARHPSTSVNRVEAFFTGVSPELTDEVAVVRRFFDWLVFLDPPQHARLRRLLMKAFSPAAVARLAPSLKEIADDTLDGLADRDTFDVVNDYGVPVTLQLIARMIGIPDHDIPTFKALADAAIKPLTWTGDPDSNVIAAYDGVVGLEAFFRALIIERRNRPADDLLSHLTRAEDDGQAMTDQEIVSTCAMLLVAGHETSANLIGTGILALLRHPDQLDLLRADPALIDSAVEEFLRYDGSGGGIGRIATEPIELSGGRIPAGQLAFGLTHAANHDPAVFVKPGRLDIRRSDNRHLGLGHGLHMCLGAHLARLETRTAVRALLRHRPEITLVTEKPVWIKSLSHRGVHELVVAG